MPAAQIMFLGSVLAGFGAFTFTLVSVSLQMMVKQSQGEPLVAREVTPAKRTEALYPR